MYILPMCLVFGMFFLFLYCEIMDKVDKWKANKRCERAIEEWQKRNGRRW